MRRLPGFWPDTHLRNAVLPGTLALLTLAACGDDLAADSTAAGSSSAADSTGLAATTTGTTAEPTTAAPGTTTTADPTTSAATTAVDPSSPGETTADSTTSPATTGGVDDDCGCAPNNQDIVVLSDEAELYTYSPALDTFTYLTDVICPEDQPYSMAIDRSGLAWIQFASDANVYTFDPKDPAPCQFAGISAKPAGFDYFGLSFAHDGPGNTCDHLFLMNYSGDGPFTEGPGLGALGVVDPDSLLVTDLGPTDYDGGELAGTGEGRLFAFAGAEPAKLVEFDKSTAAPLGVLPLTGLRKTRASAFAFHGGDAWFFTENVAATCHPCLEAECPAVFADCQADPACDEALECSIALGDVQDECGGYMTPLMLDCATNACVADCYPATVDVFSQVTRLDFDASDGNGQVLTQANPEAPIRIVGAAASTCAPYFPQ